MKLGCRAHDYGRHTPAELAALLAGRGYNACQLAPVKGLLGVESYRQLTLEDAAAIGAAFQDAGVEISVLGCYMDLSSPDPDIRRTAVENVIHCLELQKAMGAGCVGSESSYDHLDEEEKARRFPLLEDSVLRITEAAARWDGVFAIEPVFWYPLDSIQRTGALLDRVADPQHLGLIFDPANLLKKRDQSRQAEVWSSWLEAFGHRIRAVHIKDFILEGDTYCPCSLGQGVMDYSAIGSWLVRCCPEMPLLREEVQLSSDLEDLNFMRRLLDT